VNHITAQSSQVTEADASVSPCDSIMVYVRLDLSGWSCRLAGLFAGNPASRYDQGVTVIIVVPNMLPAVRVMVTDPGFFAVASPLVAEALLILTTDWLDELHTPP
jgi:hypothetical protein